MDNSHFSIILLVLGLGFLVAEIFIPSGGVILVLAVGSLVVSVVFAWNAWWETGHRTAWWSYLASVLLLTPISVGGAFAILPRTSFGRKILLEPPNPDELKPFADDQPRRSQLVGTRGKSITRLSPSGLVLANEERIHAESEGGTLIDADADIEIVAIKGNRVVVRNSLPETSAEPIRDDGDESALDFDLPQG